jgi:hypothetical protein
MQSCSQREMSVSSRVLCERDTKYAANFVSS